eukprot:543411_1
MSNAEEDEKKESNESQVKDIKYKQCSLLVLYNMLQQDILLCDIRRPDKFKVSHIKCAQNISDVSNLKQFKSNRYIFYSIIIYGDNESNTKNKLEHLYKIAETQGKADKFYIFDGIYNDFYNKFNFLCVDNESKQESFIEYPSMILHQDSFQLFIGDANMAQNNEIMSNLQITHIVNASSFENKNIDKQIKYFQIQILDNGSENIMNFFDKVYEFISNNGNVNNKNNNKNVFIHCMLGISRSSTLCIAYLMKLKNYSLDDAYLLVKKARPRIQPNAGFWHQLKKYQQQNKLNNIQK